MIFVFGNGLSIGFDRRLKTPAITERVVASLGGQYTGVLQDLAGWALDRKNVHSTAQSRRARAVAVAAPMP